MLKIQVKPSNGTIMKALETLGLKLKEQIRLDELLSENFNPQIYALTSSQEEKVNALRDIVVTYMNYQDDVTGRTISDSKQAAAICGNNLRRLEHEELWVAFLNRANRILSYEMLFKGSLDSVTISPRDVIAKALSKNATSLIVFHNHPSGCPTPSTADINQTRSLSKACKLMEMQLLDHIVVSPTSYYSFADECTTQFKTK